MTQISGQVTLNKKQLKKNILHKFIIISNSLSVFSTVHVILFTEQNHKAKAYVIVTITAVVRYFIFQQDELFS